MKKPSITELTGLLDKPALLKWANKIGLQGINIDDYKKQSTSNGTNLHKQIENYLLNGFKLDDEKIHEKCVKFFLDKNIISVEKWCENEYFLGRLDIKFEYNGETYIADFKTNCKGIYLEHKLQLSAYRMIEKSEKVAIISIPEFILIPIMDCDFNKCEQIMINLANIYNLKNEM